MFGWRLRWLTQEFRHTGETGSEVKHNMEQEHSHAPGRFPPWRPKGSKNPSGNLPELTELKDAESVLNVLKQVMNLIYTGDLSPTRGKAIADIIRIFFDIQENRDYTQLRDELEALMRIDKQKQAKT